MGKSSGAIATRVCTKGSILSEAGCRLAEGTTPRKSALEREEAVDKGAGLVLTFSMRLMQLRFKM